MHFTSLILSLAAATVAFAMSIPAKRDDQTVPYWSTFRNLKTAIAAPGYLTFQLVATVKGNAQPRIPPDDV
jgi:hypothetical protein